MSNFRVSLTFKTPILTQESGSINFGLDTSMLMDNGKPVLPGSLIKGNISHALQDIQDIAQIPKEIDLDKWFGKKASEGNYEPNTASLQFDEYWKDDDYASTSSERFRIAIDEKTGTVKGGALQIIESSYPANDTVTFTGIIKLVKDLQDTNNIKKWLEKALQIIPAMGALKTNGFGKLIEAKIEVVSEDSNTHNISFQETIGLTVNPIASFCFAKPAIGQNNHFESYDYIPAAAIKAAIAHKMVKGSALEENLDKVHITNALAVKEDAKVRSIAIPLTIVSTYKDNDIYFHDISNIYEFQLLNEQAPTFQTDWKDKTFNKCELILNPAKAGDCPAKRLKIRTAINQDTGTADDSKLFSMETVKPDGFDWLCTLNISRIEEGKQQDVFNELKTLFETGLNQLGKTKVSAKTKLNSTPVTYDCKQIAIKEGDKKVKIYIQSPARLTSSGFQCKPTNDGNVFLEEYKAAWKELSGGSLELSYFYASQQLEGGEHWWHRFRQKTTSGNYHPEIFTQSGSMFVLDIIDFEKAKILIGNWQKLGLPQLNDAPGGENWQENPWIAANGYGEIAINLKFNDDIQEVRSV